MTELTDGDLDKIKDLHHLWIAKELAGNSAGLVDLCTDDIQWIPPDAAPVKGQEAIAKYLDSIKVNLKQIDLTSLSIHGSRSVAYLTSNYRARYLTEGHSEVHEASGTHLWILRKAEPGNWRIAVVAWSSW